MSRLADLALAPEEDRRENNYLTSSEMIGLMTEPHQCIPTYVVIRLSTVSQC